MQRILSAWFAAAVCATACASTYGQTAIPESAPLETPSASLPAEPAGPPEASAPATVTSPAESGGFESPSMPPLGSVPPPAEPAQASTADGTTSVIAPPPDPVAPLTPPFNPPPPTSQPPPMQAQGAEPPTAPTAPTTPPPPDALPPAPASVTEPSAVLSALLEPFKGRLAGVSGSLDPQLYTRPTPLLEPLARSGDRSRRLWIVQAYWKVSAGYAVLSASAAAFERLELVAPGSDPHDRATLDVATAAARADLADARARLASAQQELVDLARLPMSEPLPWPIDRPLTDPYQAHFEAIFANRIATGRVRAIVRSLPARHEALASRAAAVTAATKVADMAEADHAQGERPIEAVIAAHAALIAQQHALIETVRTYNVEIAEYAMAVADLSLPDEQFVSMLIAAPVPWRPQPVEPVSAAIIPGSPLGNPPQAVPFPPALAPAVSGLPIQ